MSVFAFAISVTGPIFVIVALGFILSRRGTIDAPFVQTASTLVYRFGLPAILFLGVYDGGDGQGVDPYLSAFMVAMTLAIMVLAWLYARLTRVPPADIKVFVQGVFRGNLGIVGLAFCANTYGDAGLAQAAVPMGILTIVYNLVAVMLFGSPSTAPDEMTVARAISSLATNPLILSLVVGFSYRASGLPLPDVAGDAIRYFAAMTLPLALFCIGASLDLSALRSTRATMVSACAWKLLVSPALFTAAGFALGWRGQTLGVIFFLSAAPTAAASFIMVRAVRGNDKLAAGIVAFGTVMSMVTVTAGLLLLRALSLV